MAVTNRLVYDATDANSIAASSTIGGYVLAGDDGTPIGHVSDALKVDIGSVSDLDIRTLDHTLDANGDSVRLGDGTDFITSTLEGSKQALDVYVANAIDVDDGIANTAIENTATAVSTTAVNCVASALASRKYMFVANEGNKKGYFGKTGVTTANGFPLHANMIHSFRVGPAVAPQFIGGTGASSEDYRVMELS